MAASPTQHEKLDERQGPERGIFAHTPRLRHRLQSAGSSHFRAAESEAISGRVLRGRLDFLSRLFDQPIAKPSNRGLLHGLSCRDRIIRELQRPVHRQRLYQPL